MGGIGIGIWDLELPKYTNERIIVNEKIYSRIRDTNQIDNVSFFVIKIEIVCEEEEHKHICTIV